jgi:ABC-type dipeptide/oligopeptide/nickel transport system permease component
MLSFVIRRVLQSLVVLVVVISATFVLMRLAPGSPFAGERKLDQGTKERLEAKYGLKGTIPQQLGNYWKHFLTEGYLGESTHFKNRTVVEILKTTFPKSLALGLSALVIAMTMGALLGSLAAVWHDTVIDRTAMILALLGICLPGFLIAPLAVLFLAILFPVFPVAGSGTWWHFVLPSLCLAAPFSAYCARLMRTSMLEVLEQDFVRTARAKGLSGQLVVCRHALKIALLPLVSYAGPLAAHLLTGSLIIEEVFKIPGMGPFFVNSVLNRDYFLTCGVVVVYCALLLAMNLLVDILYTRLDKRIKLG